MIASLLWINASFAVPSFVVDLVGPAGHDLSWLLGIVVGALFTGSLGQGEARATAPLPDR